MKLVKLNCPSCGANLSDDINEGMKYMFCKYCGQKILVDDEVKRSEHREIKEDVAEIKKAEFDSELKLKELEYKERDDKRSNRMILILLGIMALMAVIPMVFSFGKSVVEKAQGKISAGSSSDYKGKDYHVVMDQLKDLGFTNITAYDLNDAGWLWNKEDTISEVSIDGNSSFSSSSLFDPNATITIYYH